MEMSFKSESGLEILSFPVGRLQCNCSLIWNPKSQEAILVDPGDQAALIKEKIQQRGLKLNAIVHTHAHFDHIGASEELHEFSGANLYLHEGDRTLWDNLEMQGQLFGMQLNPMKSGFLPLENEQEFLLGSNKMVSLFTPGHTPGSCCFEIGEFLFSGDTLFKGSIGRTDLWGGDFGQISKSIKSQLYSLDPDTTVIPGHGPVTQIGIERRQNPFVKI